MANAALKALIFDVDGTLADTESAHMAAFNQAFAELGLDWVWTDDMYLELLHVSGGKERILHYWQQRDPAILQADAPALQAQINRLHALKTVAYEQAVNRGAVRLRPGVLNLIDEARQAGLQLAIATTTSPANVEGLVQAIWGRPATAVFDVIAAGDEVAAKKPAPDVFLLALHRLGLPASEAVAFEDSRNGLLSALGAGLRVVLTPSLYTDTDDASGATLHLPDLASISVERLRALG